MSVISGNTSANDRLSINFQNPSVEGAQKNGNMESLFSMIEAQLQSLMREFSGGGTGGGAGPGHEPSSGGGKHQHGSPSSNSENTSKPSKRSTDDSTTESGDTSSPSNSNASQPTGSKLQTQGSQSGTGNSDSVSGTKTTKGSSTSSTPTPSSTTAPASTNATSPTGSTGDYARQTLDAGHGWGAQNGGVTGGSKADAAHVYTVTNRDQLVAALGGNNATNGSNATPKIIQIKGNIDLNTDDTGKELGKQDFGTEKNQLAHDMIKVGSNTTIIGLGSNAGISGGGFDLSGSKNDEIRNLSMTSPFDFFPGKDADGNPHGRVYSIEAKGTQNLWVDHNTFKDGQTPAGAISGDQVDFTDGANFATISNNQFLSHNKSLLIGSSDSMTSDKGKLNVTIDHNLFSGVSQRDPRVRFGNVDVANNLYQDSSSQANRFQYNLGVGVDSNMTSQNNVFDTTGVSANSLVKRFGDSGHLTDSGSLVNGQSVNLSSSPTGAGPGAGGISHLDATADVTSIVEADAGAGKLGLGD